MYSIIYYSTTQHLSPKPAESWHPWAEWSSRSLPEVLQLGEAMWWTQCLGDTSCLLKFDHLGVSTPFKHISLSLSINNSSQNNYSTHFSTLSPAAGQWPGDKTRKKGETGRVPKREYKPSQSGCLRLYEIVLGQSHIQKDLSLSLCVLLDLQIRPKQLGFKAELRRSRSLDRTCLCTRQWFVPRDHTPFGACSHGTVTGHHSLKGRHWEVPSTN